MAVCTAQIGACSTFCPCQAHYHLVTNDASGSSRPKVIDLRIGLIETSVGRVWGLRWHLNHTSLSVPHATAGTAAGAASGTPNFFCQPGKLMRGHLANQFYLNLRCYKTISSPMSRVFDTVSIRCLSCRNCSQKIAACCASYCFASGDWLRMCGGYCRSLQSNKFGSEAYEGLRVTG